MVAGAHCCRPGKSALHTEAISPARSPGHQCSGDKEASVVNSLPMFCEFTTRDSCSPTWDPDVFVAKTRGGPQVGESGHLLIRQHTHPQALAPDRPPLV